MDKSRIVAEFRRIKSLGYVTSRRSHNTGIGKTFEDLLGVTENNQKDPDFDGFEVKSQRELSKSRITLFTKSPSYPDKANAYLKDCFGIPDKTFPQIKVLHTSCFATAFNTHSSGYGFRLEISTRDQRLYLRVKDLDTDRLVGQDLYWTYSDLGNCIAGKIRSLFFVTASTRSHGGAEQFHFTAATVYNELDFGSFIRSVEAGDIMFDVRIGAYKTLGSPSFGRPHDHGSGFRIRKEKLESIFKEKILVG